jgi:hypothetical protein
MATTSTPSVGPAQTVRGTIVDAVVKVSVDATRPLPLVCALYQIESPDGVWLCAYYGANRSVFDFLPQKGAVVDEAQLGIAFHLKQFIPKAQFQPAQWEEFKHAQFMTFGGHGE